MPQTGHARMAPPLWGSSMPGRRPPRREPVDLSSEPPWAARLRDTGPACLRPCVKAPGLGRSVRRRPQPPARDACRSNPPSPLTQVSLSRTMACGGSDAVATARPFMRRTAVPTATNSIRPEPSSTM